MTDNTISLDPDIVYPGNFFTESGNRAVQTLIDKQHKKPGRDVDAIVCVNDYMAFGAITELQNRGYRIPEDIAVTGFDNISVANYASPTLSTVHQYFDKMATRAAEILIDRLEGKKIPEVIKVPTEFIQRHSCGCMNRIQRKSKALFQLPGNFSSLIHSDPRKFLHYLSIQIYNAGPSINDFNNWDQIYTLLHQPEK